MNVSGWRAEPEHIVSEHTALLLRWLGQTAPQAGDTIELVGNRIAGGFYELTHASSIALWGRRSEGDPLALLSVIGEGTGSAADADDEEPVIYEADKELLVFTPLWLDEAGGPARELVVELAGLTSLTVQPSLALALPAPASANGSKPALQGVVLLWLNSADGLLSEGLQAIFEATAAHAGQLLANAARVERLARSLRQLGESVGTAIDSKDPLRLGYSSAAAYYSGLIARTLDLPEGEAEKMEFAALLHGLGRVAVPDAILRKTGSLTPEELEKVRGAAVQGADLLANVEGMSGVADIVRHQGENFDGSGSPDGLVGEKIPLGSRILAVATRFAAMTSPRADRGPRPVVGGALDSLVAQSGTTLDPVLVEAFVRAMGRSL